MMYARKRLAALKSRFIEVEVSRHPVQTYQCERRSAAGPKAKTASYTLLNLTLPNHTLLYRNVLNQTLQNQNLINQEQGIC